MNKSDCYQYKFKELTGFDKKMFENFTNEQGLSAFLESSDQIMNDYKQQLLKSVLDIVESTLTKHQNIVLKMFLDGKTQVEMAAKLGITQSAIHKCLSGNEDYAQGKRYGGVFKKLKKEIAKNKEIQLVLEKIQYYKLNGEILIKDIIPIAAKSLIIKPKQKIRVYKQKLKLTNEQIDEITRKFLAGTKQKDLVMEYNVSLYLIKKITPNRKVNKTKLTRKERGLCAFCSNKPRENYVSCEECIIKAANKRKLKKELNKPMRKCPKCGVVCGMDNYYKDKTKKFGLENKCRPCRKAYNKEYNLRKKLKLCLSSEQQ